MIVLEARLSEPEKQLSNFEHKSSLVVGRVSFAGVELLRASIAYKSPGQQGTSRWVTVTQS